MFANRAIVWHHTVMPHLTTQLNTIIFSVFCPAHRSFLKRVLLTSTNQIQSCGQPRFFNLNLLVTSLKPGALLKTFNLLPFSNQVSFKKGSQWSNSKRLRLGIRRSMVRIPSRVPNPLTTILVKLKVIFCLLFRDQVEAENQFEVFLIDKHSELIRRA